MAPLAAGIGPAAASEIDDLRPAAEAGDAAAQYRLGLVYALGQVVLQDRAAAVRWWTRAAHRGHRPAQAALGLMYAEGQGVPRDLDVAQGWLRRTAGVGLATEQLLYGVEFRAEHERLKIEGDAGAMLHRTLEAIDRRDARVIDLLKPLAERDHRVAACFLGEVYLFGLGVPRDERAGTRWLEASAKRGYARAQDFLGTSYVRGEGVPRDESTGLQWVRQAAALGHPKSEYGLAVSYLTGLRVPKNFPLGVAWLIRAADRGDPEAREDLVKIVPAYGSVSESARTLQHKLLKSIEEGRHVDLVSVPRYLSHDFPRFDRVPRPPPDGDAVAELWQAHWHGARREVRQQVEWTLKAARRGLAEAQANLGDLYLTGAAGPPAGPPDKVHAFMWMTLAIRNGATEAIVNREHLRRELSGDEVARAIALARDWMPVGGD
jgi:TPR repeat protein